LRPRTLLIIGLVLAVFLAQIFGLVLIKQGIAEDTLRVILLRAPKPVIEIKGERLWSIGPVDITNTLFTSWIVVVLLIVVAYLASRRLQLIPSGFQNAVEAVIELLYGLVHSTVGERHARRTEELDRRCGVDQPGALRFVSTESRLLGKAPAKLLGQRTHDGTVLGSNLHLTATP